MQDTLPQLTGSEKQIKWADKLRSEFVKKIDHEVGVLSGRISTALQTDADSYIMDKYEPSEDQAKAVGELLASKSEEVVAAHPDSKFWIETSQAHRNWFGWLVMTYKSDIETLLKTA
jgi:hypothetical protein